MQHYFIDKTHKESDFFEFTDNILDYELCFRSCDSIFSKSRIDQGTRTLINTIAEQIDLKGNCLDLGCGLGIISIALIKKFGVTFDMVDINNTAVSLSKQNLIKNNVQRNAKVFYSNGFSLVKDKYNFIISNPPIKTGKELLFQMMKDSFDHLQENGELLLVIRKDHGMESLKKFLISIYNNCEILERNKGYYILHCIKNHEC